MNPADLASSSSAVELRDSSLWWHGPAFLNSAGPLPEPKVSASVEPSDPEVRHVIQPVVALRTAASERCHLASVAESSVSRTGIGPRELLRCA